MMSYAGARALAPPGFFDPRYEACRVCSSNPTKQQVREGYRRPIYSLCRPCYSKRGWATAPELTRGRLLGWKLLRWWYLSVRWLDFGRVVRRPPIRESRKRPPPPAPQHPPPMSWVDQQQRLDRMVEAANKEARAGEPIRRNQPPPPTPIPGPGVKVSM